MSHLSNSLSLRGLAFAAAFACLLLAPAPGLAADAVETALEKANALEGQGREDEVIALLAPYAESGRADVDFVLAYAHLTATLAKDSPDSADGAVGFMTARRFAERAASNGNGGAMNLLYLLYANGWGAPADREKAMGFLRDGANAKDPGAMANLAVMYFEGQPGLERDRDRACELFRGVQAADDDNPVAGYYLGLATLWGICGLNKDEAQAAAMVKSAAEAGVSAAERDYGRFLLSGMGVKGDSTDGFEWFEKAAKHGDGYAHWRLGMAYVEGEGRQPDPEKAVAHFRESADAGHPDGMVSLAVMHASGSGVTQDFGKAFSLYEQAAAHGGHHALRNLAIMFLHGQGVGVSPVDAEISFRKWLALTGQADPALEASIQAALSDDARATAKRRMDEWSRQRQ